MDHPVAKIREFVAFVRQHLTGDEKGEAQIFCDASSRPSATPAYSRPAAISNTAFTRARPPASPISSGGRASCWK